MARRFNVHMKKKKYGKRQRNKVAMQQSKIKFQIKQAKQHVVNLSMKTLTDNEYLLLSKGLKFIPAPALKGAKNDLMRDFNEFARKLRCKFLFYSKNENIHPFRENSKYEPHYSCDALENYIFQTKHELSSMQPRRFRDNLKPGERSSISSLLRDKSILIKKADKSNNVVVLDKSIYLSEAYRQLQSHHYTSLDGFDFKVLRNNINDYVTRMHIHNEIDEISFKYMINGNQKNYGPGQMHILPKIHKINFVDYDNVMRIGFNIDLIVPPGRPIISQIGTITEYIGRYVDYFLVPIVKKHHTFIRDSSDFIQKIETIKPLDNCLLCSFDISQMFTNCPIEEILLAVRAAYDAFDKSHYTIKYPSTDDLVSLLGYVLQHNIFEFNDQLYQQCLGSAIGACCAPECCNILLYQIMKEIISSFPYKTNIFYYARYMDDGIIIHHGKRHELEEFFKLANSHHKFLKFTYEISESDTTFLDVHLFKGRRFIADNILDMKTHFKPTNSFLYLHRNSSHKEHVFKAFIRGEVIRYRRSTNNDNDLREILLKFKQNLINRGYTDTEIMSSFNEALTKERKHLFSTKEGKRKEEIPLVMATKYNPCISKLRKHLLKHWHLIRDNVVCNEVFTKTPIIAYKRHRNLSDILTSTKVKKP